MDTANLYKDLNAYFSGRERGDIKVSEIQDILIPYMDLAKLEGAEMYGTFLLDIKTFRPPMSRKNWSMLVDIASFKNTDNE